MNRLVLQTGEDFPLHLSEYSTPGLPLSAKEVPFTTRHSALVHLFRVAQASPRLQPSRLLLLTPVPLAQADSLLLALRAEQPRLQGIRLLISQNMVSALVQAASLPDCESLFGELKATVLQEGAVFFAIRVKEVVVLRPGMSQLLRLEILSQGRLLADPSEFGQLVELPLCYYCLLRLQQTVSGIMFVELYQFLFEPQPNPLCKVCRLLNRPKEPPRCQTCGELSDLWACMVCGTVGCGRYRGAHASRHFQDSGHGIVLDIQSQKVWNYLTDEFVHRIIRTEEHGVVALEPNESHDREEKAEGVLRDFSYTVSDQLEIQRQFYFSKIKQLEDKGAVIQARELKLLELQDSLSERMKTLWRTRQKNRAMRDRIAKASSRLQRQRSQHRARADLSRAVELKPAQKDQRLEQRLSNARAELLQAEQILSNLMQQL